MIELNIPGREPLQLTHLVCDVNGTLAVDGVLHDGLPHIFNNLSRVVEIHLLTADTHGKQDRIDQQLGVIATRIKSCNEAEAKAAYLEKLGPQNVVAIGQGANDSAMLKKAILGVGILSNEGIAVQTLIAADIIVPDIYTALGLLENPLRIVATLRK